jgi:hypothetical protein
LFKCSLEVKIRKEIDIVTLEKYMSSSPKSKAFIIPNSYWPVVLSFIGLLFAVILPVMYFGGIFWNAWLITVLSQKEGYVLFSYFEPAVFSIGIFFAVTGIWGVPLTIVFTKLFPKVARAVGLQGEVRAMRSMEKNPDNFFATSISYTTHLLLDSFQKKMPSEDLQHDEGVKHGMKFTAKEVQLAEIRMAISDAQSMTIIKVSILISFIWLLMWSTSYLYISEKNIVRNRFFDILDQTYQWDEIDHARFEITWHTARNKRYYDPKLTVVTKKGHSLYIWNAFTRPTPQLDHLTYLFSLLRMYNIPIEVGSLAYNPDQHDVEDEDIAAINLVLSELTKSN